MRKKVLACMTSVLIVVSFAPAVQSAVTEPYIVSAGIIRDWYDLDAIRHDLGGHYVLMTDLDSTSAGYAELAGPTAHGGKGWEPIGGIEWWFDMAQHKPFYGIFEGDGYEIRDLFIDRPEEFGIGLFGLVDYGGVIQNIRVVNADVTGSSAGGLVGGNVDGTVSNCFFSGRVHGVSSVGGLVGENAGTVSNSCCTASVTGNDEEIGGLVGRNAGAVIDSFFSGTVIGEGYVGGLVGRNWYASVSDSYATGSVSGGSYVGGLVGISRGDVTRSYAMGTVTGERDYVGGLVGYLSRPGSVTNCYAAAGVAARYGVGGLVGLSADTVSNSYSAGSVNGLADVGGLVGENYNGVVNQSYATGFVTGNSRVGGLVGRNGEGTVSNSFWDTETSGQATSDGGNGKTTAEMMNRATFTGAKWHIATVAFGITNAAYTWNIVDGQTYPFLSWENPREAPVVEYNLTLSSTSGGSVTTPGEGAYTYEGGTVVTLVAVADEAYRFVNWTGDVATVANVNAAATTITMNGNYSIRANFEEMPPDQYNLSISSSSGGSVTTPGEGTFTRDEGTVVSLVASPASGYQFVSWTGDVGTMANRNSASTTITMNGNYSIRANFAEDRPEARYKVTISSTAGGSVIIPGEGSFTYGENAVVTIVAAASEGHRFVSWAGDVDTIASIFAPETTVTMEGNYEIIARFAAVVDSKTETVTNDIVDARAEADTEVEVKGTATVTVTKYAENPGGPSPRDVTLLRKWVDVYVPDTEAVTEIEIRLYYTDADVAAAGVDEESLRLFWWDGTDWGECSDSGAETSIGYIWARIRANTTPSLAELDGMPVDGGVAGPTLPPAPCGCGWASLASAGLIWVAFYCVSLRHRYRRRARHAAGILRLGAPVEQPGG